MKKALFSLLLFCAAMLPALAVAPVVAFSIVTSAATYSTVPAAASALGTIVTAITLTGAALISAAGSSIKIVWPTNDGNGSSSPTALFLPPGTESAATLSGSCDRYIKRDVIFTQISVGFESWTIQSGAVNCNTFPSYDNATVSNTCDNYYATGTGSGCAHFVQRNKLQCRSTSGCGSLGFGQSVESTEFDQVFAEQKLLADSAVKPDDTLALGFDQGAISYDLSDMQLPTTVGGDTGYPAPLNSGGVAVQFADDSGQNSVIVQQPLSTGTTLTQYSQQSEGEVQVSELAISSQGVATSHSTSVQPGYVNPLPSTSPDAPLFYSPIVQNNPGTGTGGDPDTGTNTPVQVQFPSDYARSGEAASAAQTITTALLQGDLVTPEVPDSEMPWFGSTFDGVLPVINTSGSSCPVWQFDALGESFYIDHHCQLIVDFNALFYSMFTAFWVLLAFRTVLEA